MLQVLRDILSVYPVFSLSYRIPIIKPSYVSALSLREKEVRKR